MAPGRNGNGNGNGNDGAWGNVVLGRADRAFARVELLRGESVARRAKILWGGFQKVALIGGMLVGLEAFLAEYDWGVPLDRAGLAAAAARRLLRLRPIAARSWAGRGGALGAWGVYVVVRALATLIPVVAGRSPAAMPLLLVGAICIELVALRHRPAKAGASLRHDRRPRLRDPGLRRRVRVVAAVMPLPWSAVADPGGTRIRGDRGHGWWCPRRPPCRRPPSSAARKRIARGACVGAFCVLIALGVNAGFASSPTPRRSSS